MTHIGHFWEEQAEQYLRQHGLEVVARNFSSLFYEIDLVMRDAEHKAFIEVRYRRSDRFGGAIHSLTETKQRRLKRCAALFISWQKAWSHHPCRFDGIAYDATNGDGELVWIRAAFD